MDEVLDRIAQLLQRCDQADTTGETLSTEEIRAVFRPPTVK